MSDDATCVADELNNVDEEFYKNVLEDVGFTPKKSKSRGRASKQLKKTLSLFSDTSNLQGEGVKIIFPSNFIDICSRLKVLFGLKLSGHTDTLTEASNLIIEKYKRLEIQNELQCRKILDKIYTI